MHQVTLQEAESPIASVLSDVLRGEEIIITDHDKPVARVSPIMQSQEPRRLWGSAKGRIWIAEDFDKTPEDFKDYM